MMHKFDVYPPEIKDKPKKSLSEKPTIHEGAMILDSQIGSWTEIGKNTKILESTVGDYTYDAGDVMIVYTDVGKFCSIASHTRINPGNHPKWRVTQHHFTYRRAQFGFGEEDDEEFFNWRREHRCSIGNDVWLGHGTTIMPGVKIGHGAIVGSGAVVTKDIGPYEIAVGVPAKVIKKRFDDQTIAKLLEIRWWDWERASLEERFDDLIDMNVFLEKYC
jgi:phosphonate metabolism protein (transferase hexapeptide repeat family)